MIIQFDLLVVLSDLDEHSRRPGKFLEIGTSEGCVEVDTVKKRINLDGGLSSGEEHTLDMLACYAQTVKGMGV